MTPRSKTTKPLKRRAAAPRQTTKDTAADAQLSEEPQKRTKHYVQPQVLDKIRAAAGEPVTLAKLVDEIGCPASSVQHAVLSLMKSIPQIQVVTKGQVWRWATTEPEAKPVSAVPVMAGAEANGVWHEVGIDAAGNPLVRKDGDPEVRRVVSL